MKCFINLKIIWYKITLRKILISKGKKVEKVLTIKDWILKIVLLQILWYNSFKMKFMEEDPKCKRLITGKDF